MTCPTISLIDCTLFHIQLSGVREWYHNLNGFSPLIKMATMPINLFKIFSQTKKLTVDISNSNKTSGSHVSYSVKLGQGNDLFFVSK